MGTVHYIRLNVFHAFDSLILSKSSKRGCYSMIVDIDLVTCLRAAASHDDGAIYSLA